MLCLDYILQNREGPWNPKATLLTGCKQHVDKSTAVSFRPCSDPAPAVLQPCQDRVKTIQDRPKMTQDRPKMAQDRPKMAQDRPKMSQDRPKMTQDKPKMRRSGP